MLHSCSLTYSGWLVGVPPRFDSEGLPACASVPGTALAILYVPPCLAWLVATALRLGGQKRLQLGSGLGIRSVPLLGCQRERFGVHVLCTR